MDRGTDTHDSTASSLDQLSNPVEEDENVDAEEGDPARGGNVNTTRESNISEDLLPALGRAIQDENVATVTGKVASLLAAKGHDKGIDELKHPYESRLAEKMCLRSGTSPILHAATTGDPKTFHALFSAWKPTRMRSILAIEDNDGNTLLLDAVKGQSPEVFKEVLGLAERELKPAKLRSFIEGKDTLGETLLSAAVRSGNLEMFEATLECAWTFLGHHQLCNLIESKNMLSSATPEDFSRKLWSKALEGGHLGRFESMIAVVPPEQHEQLKAQEVSEGNESLLLWALNYEGGTLWTQVVNCSKKGVKVAGNHSLDRVLAASIEKHLETDERPDTDLDTLFSLMSSYARPTTDHIKRLFNTHSSDERLPQRCLSAVTCATNPFITGMNVAVTLTKAAKTAIEAERRKLLATEKRVNALLLEIFERLPQTVRGFDRAMNGCAAFLEPRLMDGENPTTLEGPLAQMFAGRKQAETFCSVPLVMDFLGRRFTLGLPNLTDSDEVLKDVVELKFLDEGLTDEEEHRLLVRSVKMGLEDGDWLGFGCTEYPLTMLQGASHMVPRLTFLPGVQFVLAGLIATPQSYYRVPATRMALDVVLYTYFIVVVSIALLFPQDELLGSDNRHVYVAIAFVAGGLLREMEELMDGVGKYFKDRWNCFDLPGLLCLTAGMIARSIPGDKADAVGTAFFAVSAPLLVSRFLFFAQLLPMQGPMVQVIFSMAKPLIQFGVVMAVVMIGFAMSFHVLLEESESFGETFQSLFNAMLGETDFDVFSGGVHDFVATILLVTYVVVMTIMLLNLLVAVLSTAHARVQKHNEREFKVLQAGMFKYYRTVVKKDTLPAPFNLLRLVVQPWIMLMTCRMKREDKNEAYDQFKEKMGRVIFTLFMGPLAVAAGALLWVVSSPCALFRLHNLERGNTPADQKEAEAADEESGEDPGETESDKKEAESTDEKDGHEAGETKSPNQWRYVIVLTWCILGAPLCLGGLFVLRLVGLFLQFLQSVVAVGRVCTRSTASSPSKNSTSETGSSQSNQHHQQPHPNPTNSAPPSQIGTNESAADRAKQLLFPNGMFMPSGADNSGTAPRSSDGTGRGSTKTIEAMLTAAPGGVGAEDLRRFLDDPMGDDDVRADERERKATVEHVKLLRKRLEKTSNKELREVKMMIEDLREVMNERFNKLDRASQRHEARDSQDRTLGDVSF